MFDYGTSTASGYIRDGFARAEALSRDRHLRGQGMHGQDASSSGLDMTFAAPSDDGASSRSYIPPLEDQPGEIIEVRSAEEEEEEEEGGYHDRPGVDPWLIRMPQVECIEMYVPVS